MTKFLSFQVLKAGEFWCVKIQNFEFKWTCTFVNLGCQFQTFRQFVQLCSKLNRHGYFCKEAKKWTEIQSPGKIVYRIIIFRYYRQKIERNIVLFYFLKLWHKNVIYKSLAKIQYKINLEGHWLLLKLWACHVSTV